MQKNHYQLLGLRDGAMQVEVDAAHDRALRRFVAHHKEGRPFPKEDFDAMQEAYAVLRDPDRKAAYDHALFGTPSPDAFPDASAPTAPRDALSETRSKTPDTYAFEFMGSGGEYFRIWILNLVLSILTLGIYSAWAKVRREQYFHRNTLLDGSGFDYYGRPTAILKGRLIAYGIFFALSAVDTFSPLYYPPALLVVSPIFPWLLVRSFAFRARNTSYRGLRLNFHSTYRECLMTFLPYLVLFVGAVFLAYHGTNEMISAGQASDPSGPQVLMMASPFLTFALMFPALYCDLKRFQLNNLSFGDSRFKTGIRARAFYGIFFRTTLILVVFCIPLALWIAGNYMYVREGGVSPSEAGHILFFLSTPTLMLLVFHASFLAYYQSRTANFMWNNTTLDRHYFVSTQTFGGLLTVIAVNTFFTLLTLGLYWPWAKVKLAAYRARNTVLVAEGGLDNFVGKVSEETRATGEEILDVFDFDIAL
ncbi:MAG: DUF898 family protein [Candidatus Accumulibacter sp.]|jgi:uncharacterized membrane protein YjgN (DUF898 family)|nr:DUF898 family protein [Accumulibacter sp.]